MDFVTDEDIQLVAYFARSSFASAFCSGKVQDIYSHVIQSTFQRRQVRQDFSKTFAESLRGTHFDILLVDFTDERFPLHVLNDGRVITVSAELRRTSFPEGMPGRLVKPFTQDHFQLWERGWSRFMQLMDDVKSVSKIRINQALWCETTESGDGFDQEHSSKQIDIANRHFRKLFRRSGKDLMPGSFYEYDAGLFKAKDHHKWGKAPFHYADSYYHATLAHLQDDRRDAILT
jgi:Family of unknown function (DUF6270)